MYLPYKPRRRTKGQIAIEAGLEPLADTLFSAPDTDAESAASEYVNADSGIADTKAALEGARYILMERFAEDATLLAKVRKYLTENAYVKSTVVSGKEQEAAKYKDYFDSFTYTFFKYYFHMIIGIFIFILSAFYFCIELALYFI